jgi:LysM repeat protein
MISVLQDQHIRRPPRFPSRRYGVGAADGESSRRERGAAKPGIRIRHALILLAFAFLAAYLTASSGILRLAVGPPAGSPPWQSAVQKAEIQEAEILAKPRSQGMLPKAFAPIRRAEATHEIRSGETLYEIAEGYGLPLYQLILWNRITDPTKIQPGTTLRLTRPARDYQNKASAEAPTIKAEAATGVGPFEVKLSFSGDLPEGSFLWDLGDWRFAFNKTPTHVYSEPGLYTVKLRSYDNSGYEHTSNDLSVRVLAKADRNTNRRYITLDSVDEALDVGKLLGSGDGGPGAYRVTQKPMLFEAAGEDQYIAIEGGYSRLSIQGTSGSRHIYTFVSPVPSLHSHEPDYDWYKTQFGTGIRGNCGPATVAMASYWASGTDTPVGSIRSEVGMPYSNGAITFDHMLGPLQEREIPFAFREANSAADLKAVVDRGNIGIVLINTTAIERTPQDPRDNLVGRYYWDNTGHYVIVKGYSLDGKYFVVYDPIPSDWTSNRQRYKDGSSMLGRNRYYPSSQIVRGLKKSLVLEVMKK